jgi:hypothetical protein
LGGAASIVPRQQSDSIETTAMPATARVRRERGLNR